jgi:MoxR-like ATPase
MVPVAESVAKYAVSIVRATRPTDPSAPEIVKKYLNFGASVRGIQNIILAAKARALMQKRYHVSFEDVASMSVPVLRHRVLLNFHAESDKVTADTVLRKMIDSIAVPRD